jgi:SAM-dependent methyltransferase
VASDVHERFYEHHPISEAAVLAAVRRRRGTLDGLTAGDLLAHDQDHYGGAAAVEVLARRGRIGPTSRVLDLCAGLAGPARQVATGRGARVVALELSAARAAGAARLTRRVGLGRQVLVVRGDARALPFAGAIFDACLSQEALLHITGKAAVLRECHRVLVPGGRLVFTDWIAHPRLADRERARLREWMAATAIESLAGYRALLGRAGFREIDGEDITDEWRGALGRRLEAYRAMGDELDARVGKGRREDYLRLFLFLVDLVENGKLGGGRFSATR